MITNSKPASLTPYDITSNPPSSTKLLYYSGGAYPIEAISSGGSTILVVRRQKDLLDGSQTTLKGGGVIDVDCLGDILVKGRYQRGHCSGGGDVALMEVYWW